METYLKTLDVPIDEFYREVRDAQNESEDPYINTFIDCLIASTDYDSFYKVMAREGKRSETMKAMLKSSPKKDAGAKGTDSKSTALGPVAYSPSAASDSKSSSGLAADDKKADRAVDDDEGAGDKKSYK